MKRCFPIFFIYLCTTHCLYAKDLSGGVQSKTINNNQNFRDNNGVINNINNNYNFHTPPTTAKKVKKSSNVSRKPTKPYKEEVTYLDGSYYSGWLLHGKRHGQGYIKYTSGVSYDGAWLNDKQNGYGIAKFGNDGVFEGDWIDGKPNGYGKFTFLNDSVLEGVFNNFKDLRGKHTFTNGEVYMGCFVNMTLVRGVALRLGNRFKCPEYGCGPDVVLDRNGYGIWMQFYNVVDGKMTLVNGVHSLHDLTPNSVCPN